MTFTTEAPSNNGKGLALNLSHGIGVIDRAIVRFGEGNQQRNLPKFQMRSNSTKVYIPQDNRDYAVVSAENEGDMPVCFKAAENGVYTLTVSETFHSPLSTLHLIDNLTGNDVDLLQSPSYTFEAKTTDYESRFKLVFATGNADETDTFAFFSNGEIIINGEGTLQVIDMLGHLLISREVNSSLLIPHSSLTAGVYVLRLINGDDVKTQKIVIE